MSRACQTAAGLRGKCPGWPPGTLPAVRRPARRVERELGAAWVRRCGQMRGVCPNLVSTSSRRIFPGGIFYPTFMPPRGSRCQIVYPHRGKNHPKSCRAPSSPRSHPLRNNRRESASSCSRSSSWFRHLCIAGPKSAAFAVFWYIGEVRLSLTW